jgi:chaperonin GroES
MKLKPLSDRLLVKPVTMEEKTESGIIVPDTAREKPMRGEVIAVGPGKMTEDGKTLPMHVKVGDVVMYGKYSGTEFKMDKEEFLILNESDVLAIIES